VRPSGQAPTPYQVRQAAGRNPAAATPQTDP
jgi:hypothetical protein